MKRTKIAELLRTEPTGTEVLVKGWVKAFRNNQFIALNDGSTSQNLQVVVDFENTDPALINRIKYGAAIGAQGLLIESQGKGQKVELKTTQLEIFGDCNPEEFPLQPKKQSLEFLREHAHLRFRTNTFAAVFRIRHALAYAIHKFFNDKGFCYMHTPIITASDAEGAGEMFQVTTLNLQQPPRQETGEVDFTQDFFKRPTNLTVSGQLEAELGALALGEVYTFGPTFRAENSNTTRHLAEFWMIEPEIAFADLNDDATLAEQFLKYLFRAVLSERMDDMAFIAERVQKDAITRMDAFVNAPFERIQYTDAVKLLQNSKQKFEFPVEWGLDLQTEHERWLTETHVGRPVVVMNYPEHIKSFYMRLNDDGKTVAAMDVLAPGIGEIIGGSQREERLDVLDARIAQFGLDPSHYGWYRDFRRYGTVPHAGFGLGFERLVVYVCGLSNIRDAIPFPRAPGHAEF